MVKWCLWQQECAGHSVKCTHGSRSSPLTKWFWEAISVSREATGSCQRVAGYVLLGAFEKALGRGIENGLSQDIRPWRATSMA